MSRSAPRLLLLLTALGGLLCGGCGKLRQVSACRAVARDVNRAVTDIEALARAKPADEARIARRYAELATALEPRTTGVTALAAAVKDYVVVVRSTEAALKTRAEIAKQPYARLSESTRELERLVKREHAAAARIDAECTAR
jgi:hypothetical protein